jgi:glutathione S-transferase
MSRYHEHKLFLWIEGYFPKRIAYYLLSRGLCSSVEQLYDGKTNEANLKIVRITFTGNGFVSEDPDEPLPSGTKVPALRLDDTDSGKSIWIYETWSIINYIEEVFDSNKYRQIWATNPIDRAITQDILGYIALATDSGRIWLINCAPYMAAFWNIPDSEVSLAVGRRARRDFEGHFKTLQNVAANNVTKTGWLTPAADGGPGMADVMLAATVRHTELSWSEFILEDEELGRLREWYEKFKTVGFWYELEETGRFPENAKRGEGSIQK